MKLAAVGSNCIDYYNNIDGGKAYPGGGPVNMAVYTLRLGGNASYIGPVGDDVYGRIMLDAISARGVDVSHLHVKPGKTAVSQVELIDGERVFGDYEEGVLETYTLSGEDMDFICTHDVVICDLWGKVEGNLYVKDTLSLKEGCTVDGNLNVRRLSVELGSKFNGGCKMITEAEFDKLSGPQQQASQPAPQQKAQGKSHTPKDAQNQRIPPGGSCQRS